MSRPLCTYSTNYIHWTILSYQSNTLETYVSTTKNKCWPKWELQSLTSIWNGLTISDTNQKMYKIIPSAPSFAINRSTGAWSCFASLLPRRYTFVKWTRRVQLQSSLVTWINDQEPTSCNSMYFLERKWKQHVPQNKLAFCPQKWYCLGFSSWCTILLEPGSFGPSGSLVLIVFHESRSTKKSPAGHPSFPKGKTIQIIKGSLEV